MPDMEQTLREPYPAQSGCESCANDPAWNAKSAVGLSPRERAIVLLISQGMSNKEVARRLCVAPETVKSHLKRIFFKLAVRSRAAAVHRAAALRRV